LRNAIAFSFLKLHVIKQRQKMKENGIGHQKQRNHPRWKKYVPVLDGREKDLNRHR